MFTSFPKSLSYKQTAYITFFWKSGTENQSDTTVAKHITFINFALTYLHFIMLFSFQVPLDLDTCHNVGKESLTELDTESLKTWTLLLCHGDKTEYNRSPEFVFRLRLFLLCDP